MQHSKAHSENDSLFYFINIQNYERAITHKTRDLELKQKRIHSLGNNEDWGIIGHELLETLFLDYMLSNG